MKHCAHPILTGTVTMVWIFGLIMAGSEGDFMPWVNIMGLILFAWASSLLTKTISLTESEADNAAVVKTQADKAHRTVPDYGPGCRPLMVGPFFPVTRISNR